MKTKLLFIIALGTTLAVIAAGSATSGTIGGVEVDVPTDGVLPQCANLNDDDGDGLVDLGDPGCSSPVDTSEYDPPVSGGDGGSSGGDGGSTGGSSGGGGSTGGGTSTGTTGSGTPAKGAKKPGAAPGAGLFGKKAPKQGKAKGVIKAQRKKLEQPPVRNPDGSPTNANPGLTIAQFGAAPIGVPNFVIDSFEIPPFLLPIYQACGTEYSIPWQVLASINRIETAFGTNLNVSSAGAMGWMQFIPSSWQAYGVDANEDGRNDPYNPVDAICAAARYLKAAGGDQDLRRAIFAYNHADWYVDEVLLYANQYLKLPDDLIGSLTGLTEGAHFPVAADARYADDISEREALKRSVTNRTTAGNAADVVSDSPTRRGINIYSSVNAPVVAVNDGVITAVGENPKLGRFIILQDAYGNRYTYAGLGAIAESHPVPKDHALTAADFKLESPKGTDKQDPDPKAPATAGADDQTASPAADKKKAADAPVNTEELRDRLFALPERPANVNQASVSGQLDSLLGERVPAYETFKSYFNGVFKFDSKTMELRPLKVGSKVTGGTVLGRIGDATQTGTKGAPHVNFAIRPAGRGAPKIDPKPILDGWKLLETTAIYRAAGQDPFGSDASIGQVLLMSKDVLAQRVLADPRVQIYSCGRTDIESGQIDRRVLAVMEYLAERGYRLTITSLKCGHSFYTTSGNVSAHSSGNAVDIAAVNGISILGNQGPGSVTEAVIRDLLKLQGTMRPAQIISLMELGPPTFAMGDHDDHIHVGYTPPFGAGQPFEQLARVLKPEQWERLIARLGEIDNPKVRAKPSDASLPADDQASGAHQGE
ncbi:MAG TPA: lytic murein transglycosylase [Candidatus Acidoferrum sp.]|nr:lytic murein transglycosylase [Candidatus Acidoferrum sp.]